MVKKKEDPRTFAQVEWGDRVQTREFETVDPYLGRLLEFQEVEFRDGNFGPYCVIGAADLETGKIIKVSTGARAVRQRMRICTDESLFPIQGRFVQKGRSIDIQ